MPLPTLAQSDLSTLTVSIVIPFFNEEASLAPLVDELLRILNQFSNASEVIFVDDGSQDSGAEVIRGWADRDPRIKLIEFKKNTGQTAAWTAGVDYAVGEIILFLDADLQNDPSDIPMLVRKMTEGPYDVVSGWRKDRKDSFFSRRLPSVLANQLISWVTGVRLHDYGCSLKVYRAEVIKNVRLYGEMHRFLPAYAAAEGGKILEVPVLHHPRKFGKSKYRLSRSFKVILDLITVKFLGGFSTKPLYVFGSVGGLFLACGMGLLGLAAYRVFVLGRKEATPAVFLMAVFLIAGIQAIMMGLLAELAIRIYHEAQFKTTYRIRSLKNLAFRRRRPRF